MKFTQEVKDKWLARLRDPNSRQAFQTFCIRDGGTNSYCAWGHLSAVLGIDSVAAVCLVDSSSDEEVFCKIRDMNDVERLTLPQIADYIEANIPAVKE